MSDDDKAELRALKKELAELAASFKSKNYLLFAKGLAEGKSQEQAYVDAGYKSKKPNEDASKAIARCPTIAQYKNLSQKIAQLELIPKQIATFEQKLNLLWKIAQHESSIASGADVEDCDPKLRDSRAAIAAIAELNKMQGDLAAIKTDNKTTVGFRLNLAGKQ